MGARLGGILVCLLFALPFGGVGAFATWAIGATLREGWNARDWVRVRAQVESSALRTSASRRSETHQASGLYRYRFEGREYVGERLGILAIGGADNVGDWHEEMGERLEQARSSGKPITVWVNPANPAESVVDRDIRWPMIVFLTPFAIGFGGVGVGALVAAFFVGRGGGGTEARPAAKRPARAAGPARPMGLGGLWAFAILWNAIAFPITILAVPSLVEDEAWVGLLVLIFPLIGLLIVWGAVVSTWKWLLGLVTGRRGSAAPAPEAEAEDAPAPPAAKPAAAAFERLEAPTAATAFTGFGDRGGFAGSRAEVPIPESVARVAEAGGALTLDYRRGGRRAIGALLLLAGLVHLGIAFASGGLFGEPDALAAAAWAIAGIALAAAGWRMARSRLVVAAKAGELRVSARGLLGNVERTLGRGEISALEPVHAYSVSRGGGPMREVYSLRAVLRDGARVTIGTGFEGRELAESAQARIARAAGLAEALLRPATAHPKMASNADTED